MDILVAYTLHRVRFVIESPDSLTVFLGWTLVHPEHPVNDDNNIHVHVDDSIIGLVRTIFVFYRPQL